MHITVMLSEVLEALQPRDGGRYLDVTAGGGGHTAGLLELSGPRGRVLCTDADAQALERCTSRLTPYADRLVSAQAWMDDAVGVAERLDFLPLDGIVADLGLSSYQLEAAERGFSFMRDGPLDMRFDASRGQPASALVDASTVEELATLLRDYGDVLHARRIAEAIWKARPMRTTAQLRDAVLSVESQRKRHVHPATQVFQALRIAVNDELQRLARALPALIGALGPGGRLAVISFHSLEDRIVKRALRDACLGVVAQPGFGETSRPAAGRMLHARPQHPSEGEVAANPRARSAVLRVFERAPAGASTT